MSNLFQKLFYCIWYLRKPPWDTGISPPELMDYIKTHPPGKALDLGCGTGTNVITLALHGWQSTGVDFIPRAIQKARKKARNAGINVKFIIDDVIRLERISNKFDLILDIGCFHNVPPEKVHAYVSNIDRLLSEQGNYLLYGFCPSENSSTGLTTAHIAALNDFMQTLNRQEGTDRDRISVWLTFQRHIP
jgi:cyclopropane fatty-acyl-phospholipid synthase-like methyltransferase